MLHVSLQPYVSEDSDDAGVFYPNPDVRIERRDGYVPSFITRVIRFEVRKDKTITLVQFRGGIETEEFDYIHDLIDVYQRVRL